MLKIIFLILALLVGQAEAGMISKGESTVVQDEGTSLTKQDTVNFIGAGVSCVDGSGKVDCTISGGSGGTAGSPLFVQTATATAVTSATETTILGTGAGSLTIPVNWFTNAGTVMDVRFSGKYTTAAVPGTLQLKLKFGATVVAQTVAFTPLVSVTDGIYSGFIRLIARTVGATGTIFVADGILTTGSSLTPGEIIFSNPTLGTAVTIDTTATQVVDLTATWGTGATNSITGYTFEMVGPGSAVSSVFGQTGAVANLSGDVTTSGSSVTTIAANSVALATDTTGNYVSDLIGGAGITVTGGGAENSTITVTSTSSETDFLISGALTCGAATQGKAQVHTTPLQYCDNSATPTLRYSAYGDSAGVATSATALAANGANCAAGNYPLGVDASGAAEGCTAAGGAEDPATSFTISDEFASGATLSSGQIGSLGWMSGGCTSSVSAEANRPGIVRLDTGTTANAQCAIWTRQSAGSGIVQGASLFDALWYVRLNTNDANTLIRVGMSDNCGAGTFEVAYFEKLAADTTWFRVTRLGATETRTNTTIATSTAWVKFRVRRTDANTIGFTIDANAEQTNTTNTPAGTLQPCMYIDNNTAASKTVDVDYFRLKLNVTR